MNLIFDIDDTITNETEFMVKYAPAYLKKKFNVEFKIANPNGYDVCEVFGLKDYLQTKNYSKEELEFQMKKINSGFWNKYFIRYMFYPLKKDVSKTIKALRKNGYKINFVSLRGKKTHENEKFFQKIIRKKIVPILTKMQLRLNNIKYDQLILVEENSKKVELANQLNAKIVFDDNVEVLENLNASVSAVCVETPHNILSDLKTDKITRIPFNFENIMTVVGNVNFENSSIKEQRSKVKNKKQSKVKNLSICQKVYTESFYKVVRNIGKGSVINHYNPIVLGEENLPKEKGADVFVGNHRNIKDPLITIALLENPTHFAALKRMFEYNENIFGPVGKNFGTLITTVFVKSIGALPIARPTDTDYRMTNLQTFKYISDYLKNNSAVAIYPEGTLNREPDKNGNILPLKSNQAFKIAENGKGVIRPVAIVWIPEEANSNSRVIISFLKPIYTEGLKSQEIADKWTVSVNDAIDSMNKIIDEMTKVNSIATKDFEHKKIKTLNNK